MLFEKCLGDIRLLSRLDTIRLCLTYNNFSYAHIMMKEGKLISFDHIKINLCIYDIYNMYQKIPELIFDFDVILDSYFCKLKLLTRS